MPCSCRLIRNTFLSLRQGMCLRRLRRLSWKVICPAWTSGKAASVYTKEAKHVRRFWAIQDPSARKIWRRVKKRGYTVNSIVGKSGMEEYLEDVLQGRDGKKEVYVDNMGRVTQDLGVTEEVRAGKDVYLTIDLELQQKTYEALERKIADILLANIINAKTFDKTAVKDAVEIKIPVY